MLKNLMISAALAVGLAGAAMATPEAILPSRADVTGVAAGDTLNLRSEPGTNGMVLGTLPRDARGIEVTGFDQTGKWARVSMPDSSAWASARFLTLQRDTWSPGKVPTTLRCFGTEPFWSLSRTDQGMEFSRPDAPTRKLELRTVMDRGIAEDATRSLIAGDDLGRITALIQPKQCSDGMSDREFGLSATLILDGQKQSSQMLTGCCSVAAR